jgi:glycosyltransferase involved in cell wall biosynthesis
MKVVLASTALDRGGVWRHIQDLALGLQGSGCEVAVALQPAAVTLQAAAKRSGLAWMPLQKSLRSTADVWHLHLHDTYDRTALMAIAGRRPFGPVVVTEHLPRTHASDETLAPYFKRSPGARVAKTAFKRSEYALTTAVIAVGSSSAEFLTQRYGISADKLIRVHNGIELPAVSSPPAPANRPLTVLGLGSLIWQKGFDLLLEAASISDSTWTVKLAGTGAQQQQLRAVAERLPEGRVELLGWVEDPREHLLAADVVCMPSRWESFPYTALEAAAAARPVVGTRVDGLDEIVLPGETGLLVEPESPRQLARALDALAAEPRRLSALGAAASEHARRFALSTMVDQSLAVYRGVLAAASRS